MGTIYIPEPQQPTDYDISSYSLYVMKINVKEHKQGSRQHSYRKKN